MTPTFKNVFVAENEQTIRIVSEYISHIQSLHPNGGAENLILVLKIYRQTLKQKFDYGPPTFDWLETMKTAMRMAETLLEDLSLGDWSIGEPAQNHEQRLATILVEVIDELLHEIHDGEGWFPELKFMFDRRRSWWHKMKTESDEALKF